MKGYIASLFALAGPVLINALPVLESRAVSSALLSQLALYEQWSAAAYCPSNNIPGSSTLITCSSGVCPQVQSDKAVSILEFQNEGIADAQGFVAVDSANKQVVVSYRGSHSVANFLADLNLALFPFLCNGCWVHSGFLSSWLATKTAVVSAVKSAMAANPGYSLVCTGHSLGAAIATLAVADLRSNGYPNAALYTYGSPMVGNNAFATFVTNQGGGNYRVTHQSDIVPKLPGYEILGYRHVSPQYWITSGDGATVGVNDVQMSTGTQDTSGNYGASGISVSNHLWYFNAVASCAADTLQIT